MIEVCNEEIQVRRFIEYQAIFKLGEGFKKSFFWKRNLKAIGLERQMLQMSLTSVLLTSDVPPHGQFVEDILYQTISQLQNALSDSLLESSLATAPQLIRLQEYRC